MKLGSVMKNKRGRVFKTRAAICPLVPVLLYPPSSPPPPHPRPSFSCPLGWNPSPKWDMIRESDLVRASLVVIDTGIFVRIAGKVSCPQSPLR